MGCLGNHVSIRVLTPKISKELRQKLLTSRNWIATKIKLSTFCSYLGILRFLTILGIASKKLTTTLIKAENIYNSS